MTVQPRLVVLLSGGGTNLQALLTASAVGRLPADIVAVVSNRPDAYGLERARQAGLPAIVLEKHASQTRRDYDVALAAAVAAFQPDWVILAGWMRLLTVAFLECFPGRVVNLHPALPGMFPGVDAIARAYAAFQLGVLTETGVMVHLVPDEAVDSGPVLGQTTVPIYSGDTLADLEARVHAAEHELVVTTLARLVTDGQGALPHE
ncbi:MAG: phosphoribosylglycinamide formyltransferase [Anaerolineales bacterium]|nr:phosphoribosylglycinamide formyltransferase [Anaerolineales bacterium]